MDQNLNVRAKTIKLLEENSTVSLSGLGLRNIPYLNKRNIILITKWDHQKHNLFKNILIKFLQN